MTRDDALKMAEWKQEVTTMYKPYNPNPELTRVGDCAIRAVCRATGQSWEMAFVGIAAQGFVWHDMPSSNRVWGAYLRENGFTRHSLPDDCPDCYTLADFCRDHPTGCYVVAINGHVVCVQDGDWFDTWDSGGEMPIYYWKKE